MKINERSAVWSVTINNPTSADEEDIALARQKGWRVDGQLEKGENGTPHYQLIVKSGQQRFSALKKAFPRAHIEPARDVVALEKYVKKEETREGELPTTSEMYPSQQKMWDMFTEYVMTFRGQHNDWGEEIWLKQFKRFIAKAIEDGYVVENMAVNPQTLSIVKTYGENIVNRSLRRQTDRQTDKSAEVELISHIEENASENESQSQSESTVSSSSDEG